MKNLKIALGQMRVIPGQLTKNFETIVEFVQRAKQEKTDLIVFPELCLTGYLIGDQFLDNEWIRFAESFNEQIKALSDGIMIIWGNVVTLNGQATITNNDSRTAKLNAALFAYNGHYVTRKNGLLSGVYPKRLFPNYRMFDDQRYFLPGRELEEKLGYKSKSLLDPLIVHYQGETISFGIEVCEDMWDQAYGFSPSTEYLKQGVDILVNISASPWTLNKQQSRLEVMSAHAKVPFIFVNKVGAENNGKNVIFFEGSSLVMNAQGNIIASANDKGLSECLITRLDSLASSEKTPDKLYHMLIQAIRYIDELWFPQKNAWIIGLSGGIDSAVNAALLSIALGKDRVKAFSLPSQYNSEKTKNNSRHIANMLNIFFQEIPIDPLVDAYLQTLGDVSSLTKENIQARVRGNVLMAKAAEANGVVVNNGNKIEIAIGYTTLYGDSIGALAPLGDLTKVQVNELAKTINTLQNATIIPTNLIATEQDGVLHFQTPPSAELKDKQIDPMKWGYHDALIDHLFRFPSLAPERWQRMFIEATFPEPIQKLLAHYNLLQGEAFIQDLEWILRLWNQSYFKRVQLPPNIIVSTGAFGYDYREAQMPYEKTLVYEQLKQKILSIKQYSK